MKNLIIANWKMNPQTYAEAEDLIRGIIKNIEGSECDVVICPPFIYLESLKGLPLGAQNVFYEDKGAHIS